MSPNNRRKRKTDLKTLVEVIFIILDAATLGTIFVFIGHDAGGPFECSTVNKLCSVTHDTTPLGTWQNMPLPSVCGTGNTTAAACELMGNQTYRGLLVTNGANGINVGLIVQCILPSSAAGAFLQLQYANYSSVTQMNSSNFVNISPQILVDNEAGWPCPGIMRSIPAVLPVIASANTVFEFRVVGGNGNGLGDNPRFSQIQVSVNQPGRIVYYDQILLRSTTQFRYVTVASSNVFSSVAISSGWIATNVTASSCVSLAVCFQHGQTTCTIASGTAACPSTTITFATPFSTTPDVTLGIETGSSVLTLALGTINLLSAQTLTV